MPEDLAKNFFGLLMKEIKSLRICTESIDSIKGSTVELEHNYKEVLFVHWGGILAYPDIDYTVEQQTEKTVLHLKFKHLPEDRLHITGYILEHPYQEFKGTSEETAPFDLNPAVGTEFKVTAELQDAK